MSVPSIPAAASFLDQRQADACVHCGLCLSACPTYLETGNENDSPRGRIHLMRATQSGRLPLTTSTVRHLDLCLGCRACETACPSGVPYGALLEATRSHIEATHRRPVGAARAIRWWIENVFPYPRRLRMALVPARIARAIRIESLLPRTLQDWLALVPDRPPHRPRPAHLSAAEAALSSRGLPAYSPACVPKARGRVGLITGCVMQVLFETTHHNTIRILNAAGYDVVVPPGQGCCGALHAHAGKLEAARAEARKLLAAYSWNDLDAVVINAAGCGSTLKEYEHLLGSDPKDGAAAATFAGKVRDLTEILVESPDLMASLQSRRHDSDLGRVTCHDACHLAHAQGVTEAPRRLIRAVAGERFVEMLESDVCCGSAGSYNLTEPAMARRLQERKTAHIAALGSVTVVTTNPGCLLQIQSGLRSRGLSQARVIHIADWLVEVLGIGA